MSANCYKCGIDTGGTYVHQKRENKIVCLECVQKSLNRTHDIDRTSLIISGDRLKATYENEVIKDLQEKYNSLLLKNKRRKKAFRQLQQAHCVLQAALTMQISTTQKYYSSLTEITKKYEAVKADNLDLILKYKEIVGLSK